jgi:multidrug efflux pump subunit AcrA (membrane-fusion protein)
MFSLLISGCGESAPQEKKTESADTAPGVSLSEEQVARLGIATRPATAMRYAQQIGGYGVVIAMDAIAQSDSDLIAAQAVAAQSQAVAARAKSLATGAEAAVSRETAEAARSKAAADQAALTLARGKAVAAFGSAAPWRRAASHQAIMNRLASGKTVLVRVTFALGSINNAPPDTIQVARLGAGARFWTAHIVWKAPADSALPGNSFYALIDGSDLAQNEHLVARISVGREQAGVIIPSTALIYSDSQAWVYVEIKPGRFLKVRIDTARPVGDGYFIGEGVAKGQPVVTDGAGLLLARETNPGTDAER